jgi:hypothetical protein
MAIYPLKNNKVVNYDVLRTNTFKSGMVLSYDSNGNAVIADRSSYSSDSVREQLGKFIGFASDDHDLLNTIIMSDPVGSSYLDSNNRLIDNVNNLYSQLKRSINEFSDENVSKYYNVSDRRTASERGVGVYNLEGEVYATDQFVKKLAYLIHSDSTTDITFSPGDLLTFGAGVNAGKLVKVDTSGFGPNVVIVGIVESFDSGTNVLYFRHILNIYRAGNIPLITSGAIMNLDASNPLSYSGTGNTWYDLSGNGLNAQLLNGTSWSSDYNGMFVVDGANDMIEVLNNSLLDLTADFTIETYYYAVELTLHGIISKRNPFGGGVGVWTIGSFFSGSTYQNWFWNPVADPTSVYINSNTLVQNFKWYSFVVKRESGQKSFYLNGAYDGGAYDATNLTNIYNLRLAEWQNASSSGSYVAAARIFNRALTDAEIRQNVNSTMSRLII